MVTKGRLLEARKLCVKGTGLNNIVIVDKTGKIFDHRNQPCLAGALRHEGGVVYFIDWPFSYIFGKKISFSKHEVEEDKLKIGFNDKQEKYLKWLVQQSAWSPAFLTKDTAEILKLGMLFNVQLPLAYVIQANILLRYLSEQPQLINYWNKISVWTEPHIALWFSHNIQKEDSRTFNLEYHGGIKNTGHSAFPSSTHTWKGRLPLINMVQQTPFLSNLLPMMDAPLSPFSVWDQMAGIWGEKTELLLFPASSTTIKYTVWGETKTRMVFSNSRMKSTVKDFLDINNLVEYGAAYG